MNVLLAEDNNIAALILRTTLERQGFKVVVAKDGVEALSLYEEQDFRLVISDWVMPGMDGLELCRRVRAVKGKPYVYFILLTARQQREDRLEGLQAGADDFLTKPLDQVEFLARLGVARRLIDMQEELRARTDQVLTMHAELEVQNAKLAELATSDGLTGLKNHRFFREVLESSYSFAMRQGIPLSVVMLDVDQFKPFNDAYGHPAGDQVLRKVADTLKSSVREHDLVARYGGEEFVILFNAVDVSGSRMLAERIRESIASADWPLRKVTASFGVATTDSRIESASHLVDTADKALYASKTSGRNRVTHAAEIIASPIAHPHFNRSAHSLITADSA